MLLQQIVALFDGELERLSRLREIVSGLAGPSVLELRASEQAPSAQIETLESEPSPAIEKAKPARVKTVPKERKATTPRAKVLPEATALSGAIPKAPVVVTAEALARETARARPISKKEITPRPEPGSLGSMIRALRLEPNSSTGL